MRTRILIGVAVMVLMGVLPAAAATISGVVTDTSGAAMPGTRVVLRDVATRQEFVVVTGPDGRFSIEAPTTGTYLISVTREGFSEAAQTLVIDDLEQQLEVPLSLEVGSLATAVVVTASRAERDTRQIPLHVDTISKTAVEQTNQSSTGDALTMAANITPVGNGPFGVRPRLRGLDSTRLLVLVDGERLNTARQATDRTGAEVGLVSPDADQPHGSGQRRRNADVRLGRVGRHHQHHHQRGVVHAAAAVPLRLQRFLQLQRERHARHRHHRCDSAELHPAHSGRRGDYDNYKAGDLDVEDTRPYFESGVLDQKDTIDDNFGFNFGASRAVQHPVRAHRQRGAERAGEGQLRERLEPDQDGDRRSLRVRYQRRRMEDVGFPISPIPTSSTRRRCRTATSIGCRPATRRRPSRRGWPTSR